MENSKAYPLVSILTVVYNSAEFLREAVESVLSCDYPNLELVVCDDCSTDDSAQIIESYTDKRIRFFKNETNLGEYANRNKCVNLALGDYFLFVDGDDTLLKQGLTKAVEQMEKYPNAPFGLVVADAYFDPSIETIAPKETFDHVYSKKNILHQYCNF